MEQVSHYHPEDEERDRFDLFGGEDQQYEDARNVPAHEQPHGDQGQREEEEDPREEAGSISTDEQSTHRPGGEDEKNRASEEGER